MILDTNAVSALLTGHQAIGRIVDAANGLHLPLPVVAEYQFGLLGLPKPQRLTSLFRRLETMCVSLIPDRETASRYAAIRFDLKRRGRAMPSHDLWIAALARQYDLEIVSRDAHFDFVSGINRLAW